MCIAISLETSLNYKYIWSRYIPLQVSLPFGKTLLPGVLKCNRVDYLTFLLSAYDWQWVHNSLNNNILITQLPSRVVAHENAVNCHRNLHEKTILKRLVMHVIFVWQLYLYSLLMKTLAWSFQALGRRCNLCKVIFIHYWTSVESQYNKRLYSKKCYRGCKTCWTIVRRCWIAIISELDVLILHAFSSEKLETNRSNW